MYAAEEEDDAAEEYGDVAALFGMLLLLLLLLLFLLLLLLYPWYELIEDPVAMSFRLFRVWTLWNGRHILPYPISGIVFWVPTDGQVFVARFVLIFGVWTGRPALSHGVENEPARLLCEDDDDDGDCALGIDW